MTFVYPLPPSPTTDTRLPGRFGLTFDYVTTEPLVPYKLRVTFPPDAAGGQRAKIANGYLRGKRGATGRFCIADWSNDPLAKIPGRHCYDVTIEGVSLPEICADVVNPNYSE